MARDDLHGPWSAVRRSPMLRMTVPFLAGIIAGQVVDAPLAPLLAVLAVLTGPTVLATHRSARPSWRWQRGLLQAVWFVSFGLAWQAVRSPRSDPYGAPSQPVEGVWLVEIGAVNSSSARSVRADARLIGQYRPGGLVRMNGTALLTLLREPNGNGVVPGDVVVVSGGLEPITRLPDPGGFDRRQWAASRGIGHEMLGMRDQWQMLHHTSPWSEVFAGMREDVSDWLSSSGLKDSERALVRAMVLGERDELDGERRDAFVRSGTVHVLAVSGMHVGLIFVVLTFLTKWWGRSGRARWIRGLAILTALWFYAALTGAAPSVLRATIMFSAFTVAGMVLQRTESINSLFAAAMMLLLIDPGMIRQAGFQLSFLAVLGIILFQRPLELMWSPRLKPLRWLWSLMVLSVSAQTLTTPLSLFLFKAFPVWFLPANLVVVLAAIGAVYGGVALIVLHAVPYVRDVLVWILRFLLRVIDTATAFFADLPGAYPAIRVELPDMLMLYVLILSVGAWWRWQWGAARTMAFLCACGLLIAWTLRADEARQRAEFVVYDQPIGFVAGILDGRELVVCSSADSLLVDEGVLAKLQRHQRQARIGRVMPAGTDYELTNPVLVGPTVLGGGRWLSNGFDILLCDGTGPIPGEGCFDAVLLHGFRWVHEERLDRLASLTHRFVLAPDVSWGARDRIHAWAEQHDIALHDVRLHGAFVLERTEH